jgi:hypothetical protein
MLASMLWRVSRPPFASFDHLVGAPEEARRDREAERPCRSHIYREFEPRWLLNRKIGRFGAHQYPIYISSGFAKKFRKVLPYDISEPY